jgi:hypothetical protein
LGCKQTKSEDIKITQSDKNITPSGGFNFCYELFNKTSLPQLIDRHLGKIVTRVGFDYSGIFANQMAVFLHEGDCTVDINEHLRSTLKQV